MDRPLPTGVAQMLEWVRGARNAAPYAPSDITRGAILHPWTIADGRHGECP